MEKLANGAENFRNTGSDWPNTKQHLEVYIHFNNLYPEEERMRIKKIKDCMIFLKGLVRCSELSSRFR